MTGRQTSGAGRLARYGFGNADRALDLLGPDNLGIWDPAANGPIDDAAHTLLETFSIAADPDLALRQLARLMTAAGSAGCARQGLAEAMAGDARLRRRVVLLLGVSTTLGDHLVANPDEWSALLGETPSWPSDYTGMDVSTIDALYLGYRRVLMRIVAGDITGGYDIEAVMRRLSALADATMDAALAIAAAEDPQAAAACRLAVIAMGKCGGLELNYVSDVDVVFVAAVPDRPDPDDAQAGTGSIGSTSSTGGTADADTAVDRAVQAATSLAARMINICGQVAWPIDATLRPEGSRGALVRSLGAYLAYYRRWAKTWEFQALLKARPAAGDIELGQNWMTELTPFVWQAAERPEAISEIRQMRRRIVDAVPIAELSREIKRGPGGLRDIEFAVQLLQLVHGRGDERLRGPATLPALRALTEAGYVGLADGEALIKAYRFLRIVEHRLQLQRLQRTHTVPDDPAALRWLAAAIGYRGGRGGNAVDAFHDDWVRHAGEVRRLHAKLLYRPLLEAVAKVPTDELRLTTQAAKARLEALGFGDPAGALRHIQALTGGVSRTAAIQRQLLPVLLSEFADAPEPDRGLLAYRQVSESLGNTPWYLRLLRDEGPVAIRLARLLGLSRYVTDLLARDPEALRLLADDTELTPRDPAALHEGFAAIAARHANDPERAILAVRAQRRRELFRLACADLLGMLDVSQTGDALAAVTDATLAAAMTIATVAVRRGLVGPSVPEDLHGYAGPMPVMAIIAMGRLGGCEMSYPSDADVLFVYEPPPGVPDDVASGVALAVADQMRALLAKPAPDPPLGIDPDLRPEGRQGPLVRSLAAYQQYYARWSKTWEAQALLRARHCCGDGDLGQRFLALADTVRYPEHGLSAEQIVEIRRIKARVDSERLPRGADPATHTKLGRGGLADVEWAVQLLQLRYGSAVAGLRTPRTLEALAAARDAGLVVPADAAALAAAWRQATRVRNLLTLVRGRASDQLPRQGSDLTAIVRANSPEGAIEQGAFVDDYLRVARTARLAVERIFDGQN